MNEYKKAFLSELNSIYVALTRPKNELYGFIPKKIGNSFNPVKFLISEEWYCQGKQQRYEATQRKDISILDIPSAVYPGRIDYLRDEFLKIDQLRNRKQRLIGEVLHYALALIGNLSECDKEKAALRAFTETEFHFPQIDDLSDYKAQINKLLEHQDLQRFFYNGDAQVFTEREIVNAFGHTKRCDRLIIFKDEVWVVDFKSTRNMEGRDYEQIHEYKDILKEIYSKRTIRGFLIYLDQFEAEEV